MGLRFQAGSKVGQSAWLRIGGWLVNPSENRLVKSEENALDDSARQQCPSQQCLEPKLMNLLLWLAQHANEVQSNEVLLQHVWGGTFYSDNPLHRSIAVLRRALGDSARNPSFIRTIRKRGYQLIANVSSPVREPARVGSLSLTSKAPSGRRLDDVLGDAARSQPAALPLLQFALAALYERRSKSRSLSVAYAPIGSLAGALVPNTELTAMQHVNAGTTMARIFQRMVELNADHRGVVARWVACAMFELGDLDNASAYFTEVLSELASLHQRKL